MKQPLIIPVRFGRLERYQNVGSYPYFCNGREEVVQDGQISDGASVPRIAWWFLPPDGLHRAAALPHDDVYGRRGRMPSGHIITRKQADLMLYERMVIAGVDKWRAVIVYRAVRMFGWYAWMRSTGTPIVLPVRNEAPRLTPRPARNRFTRHIYATVLTP